MSGARSETNSDRTVQYMAKAIPAIDGAGVKLKRAFGNLQGVNLDPFLLLDNMYADDPKDVEMGFPWHPHRGIETVTYIIDGEVEHEDSLGNKGKLGGGEIQWMTAGSGIIHQEMPRPEHKGILNGFQLWVNLPRDNKMMLPRYQDIKQHQINETSIDNSVQVKVLAGGFNEIKGPVQDVVAQPVFLDIQVEPESEFTHVIPEDHTVIAYVVDGKGHFEKGDRQFTEKEYLVVLNKGKTLNIHTKDEGVRFLLMAGKPINEPVAWHGPIVMNTREELIHAFTELEQGKFIKHEYRI